MNLIKRLLSKNFLLSTHGAPLILSERGDFLQCTQTKKRYPVKNNVIDFFNNYSPLPEPILEPPREFVCEVAKSLGIAIEKNSLLKVAEAIKGTINIVDEDRGITSEIRELASRMKLPEPDWYASSADQYVATEYPVNTHVKVSIVSHFIGEALPRNKTLYRSVRIRNEGDCILSSNPENGFCMSYHWLDAGKNTCIFEGIRSPLPRDIRPGEEITVAMEIRTPPKTGLHYIQICPLQELVSWNEAQSAIFEVDIVKKTKHMLSEIKQIKVPFDFNEEIEFVRDLLNRRFGDFAEAPERPLLLEIGGGVYPQCLPLSASRADVISLDISLPMSQLGTTYWSQESIEANPDHFAFITANANNILPFREKIFDGIVICATLHHFADPIDLLRRLQRYLKDDAIFIIVREPCNPNPLDVQYLEDIQKGINEQQFELAEYAYIFREANLVPIEAYVRSSCSLMVILKKSIKDLEGHGRGNGFVPNPQGRTMKRQISNLFRRFSPGFIAKPSGKTMKGAKESDDHFIDVQEFLKEHSVEDLCRSAEAYFARITHLDHMLAKPFYSLQDVQHTLVQFSHLIHGLRLIPEMTVIDFGCGLGWASRLLNQMGLAVISLDVSETALEKARELISCWPVFGNQPEHRFLHFDGRRIEIEDESVDRIFCFDAFHHIPNQLEVLKELSRILKRGGRAGFSEPGPNQSKDPNSQMEMRKYGVLENDIMIDDIWEKAKRAGFTEIELAIWNIPPLLVSLEEFNTFPKKNEIVSQYLQATEARSKNFNIFFLQKGAPVKINDSRDPRGLTCLIEWDLKTPELSLPRDSEHDLDLEITNTSHKIWLPSGDKNGSVNIGGNLSSVHTSTMVPKELRSHLSSEAVMPGTTLAVKMSIPPLQAGIYDLEIDLVSEFVCWFQQTKKIRLLVNLTVKSFHKLRTLFCQL